MTNTVNANNATKEQLKVLLQLSEFETEAVIKNRPFETNEEFCKSLPRAKALLRPHINIDKLDINTIQEDQFKLVTGLSNELVNAIISGRPYFFIYELTEIHGINAEVFGRIVPYFRSPSLQYKDKLSGRDVNLTTKSSEAVIRYNTAPSDVESALSGLSVSTKQLHEKGPYGLVQVKDSESGTHMLRTLKDSPSVKAVFPAFDDDTGVRRYIDPEFLVVQFKGDISNSDQKQTINASGMEIFKKHRFAGLYTLSIPDSRINPSRLIDKLTEINASDRVKFAEPLFLGFDDLDSIAQLSELESAMGLAWNHQLVNLEKAWRLGKGDKNVIVALIDTGVAQNHPALVGSFIEQGTDDWDFDREESIIPIDEDGHGTFIAGLLAGNGYSGVYGICPDCKILPLRIPLVSGQLSYVGRREAILYALEKMTLGRRLILNISWKTAGDITLIRDAIAIAENHGAIVVASAGNWPLVEGETHYPSDYETVLSVGAVQQNKTRAIYSYYGGGVDIAAPGGSGSGDPTTDLVSIHPGGSTVTSFGTSFAAPHVAGVAALLLSREPTLSPAEVRGRILSTSFALPLEGLGKGLIDASATIENSQSNSNVSDSNIPEHTDSRSRTILLVINTWQIADLISHFNIPQITAQIIIIRRPFEQIEDICNIIGMTTKVCDNISTVHIIDNSTTIMLIDVNSASFNTLVNEAKLPTLTASLILVRRPFTSIDEIANLLGMTRIHLARLTVL